MKNENMGVEDLYLAPEDSIKNENDKISLTNTDELFIMEKKSPEVASVSAMASITDTCGCCPNISMETAIDLPIGDKVYSCLCCPEAALWFKITPNHDDSEGSPLYTIHSNESLDVQGYLYRSNGLLIASNDNHLENRKFFKIARRLIKGQTYYLKVTGNGTNKGRFYVRVAKEKWPESVTVSPLNATVELGKTLQLISTVLPEDADNRDVLYLSENEKVATVHPTSGLVSAVGEGNTNIRVYDWKQRTPGAVCNITVKKISVTSVTLDCSKIIMKPDDSDFLSATVSPSNASNQKLHWYSDNPDIVEVDEDGYVYAVSDGTANITVETEDGGYTATCTIIVDSREKVTIKKDDHSFYVEFDDGKVWKNIGIDLSKREENYNQMYPPNMWYENYEYLIEEEQRYFDNIYVEENGVMEYKTYSVKQIAYLYLLDPVGIEYYMRNHACHDKDIMSGEFLSYKDEVYEAIFGNSERLSGRFYFTIVDGSVRYGRYSGAKRMDVYSNAEIIFGSHTIFNWSSFWQSIGETIFENIPVISHILLGVEMYQALFYSGSIVSAMSGVASEFLDDYAKETKNTVLEKMLGWPKTVFDCFTALADALVGAFELNNLKDMDIYAKIQEQDYRTVFDRYGSELTIQEIISKCTNA